MVGNKCDLTNKKVVDFTTAKVNTSVCLSCFYFSYSIHTHTHTHTHMHTHTHTCTHTHPLSPSFSCGVLLLPSCVCYNISSFSPPPSLPPSLPPSSLFLPPSSLFLPLSLPLSSSLFPSLFLSLRNLPISYRYHFWKLARKTPPT